MRHILIFFVSNSLTSPNLSSQLRHMYQVIKVIVLGILMGPLILWGQEETNRETAPEKLHVHLDRSFYCLGEPLWYKVYFLQPVSTMQSKVVHVEMVGPEGRRNIHQKLIIQENVAWGDMYLSPDWPEGYYRFRAYTLWGHNFDTLYHVDRSIPLFAPQSSASSGGDFSTHKKTVDSPVTRGALSITAEIDPPASPRDTVSLRIRVRDKQDQPVAANLSLSVCDARLPLGNQQPGIVERDAQLKRIPTNGTQASYPAELGLSMWVEREASVFAPIVVIPTYQGNPIYYTQSDDFFLINLPTYQGKAAVQVYPVETPEDYTASFRVGTPTDLLPLVKPIPIPLPRHDSLAYFLTLSHKRQRFRQIFRQPSLNTSPSIRPPEPTSSPDQRFWSRDYVIFPDLETFIGETVYIRFKRKKGVRKLQLLNLDHNLWFRESPLFVVNGHIVNDIDQVLSIPWRTIERVELFLTQHRLLTQYGPLGKNGVMALYTYADRSPTFMAQIPDRFEIEGFTPPRDFGDRFPDTNTPASLPDFRATEYWNPHVLTNAQGEAVLRFPHSDAMGTFRVRVEGIDTTGRVGEMQMEYEVAPKP